ncbi:hypothetical protein [Flavobacterium restrictum]|uniref:SGNH/GDSL hydrolase family protein n=1 Tax=Flavobacterium restrictum TaxID=2594428 RepID=A0A553E861_9FLAO|nr:hypothetical protein [Flavobacterium restrictum]TRX41258.1 hypothetical protein FNW21_03950 [Flavobacterium restrictum]
MKRFVLLVLKMGIGIALIAILLDLCYTQVYLHDAKRNKVAMVYHSKPTRYDVVILGSSRANNHFVAPMFEKKGLKTFNYGMSGGHLFEASLMLKVMLERGYTLKNVVLEADLSLANEQQSELVAAKFLPYLHDSKTIATHFATQPNFWAWYYLPFYRYIAFEPQIGMREVYATSTQKQTNVLDNLGYYPLGKKPNANMKNNLTNLKPLHNRYYQEIKQICKTHNIHLITLMTPMCTNVVGIDYFDKVKQLYPEIYNYENAVEGDQYFSSCGHLNDAGARRFTARIIKDFFNK